MCTASYDGIISYFCSLQWTRSLMDKIKDSGSLAQGSIPCGFTKKKNQCLILLIFKIRHFSLDKIQFIFLQKKRSPIENHSKPQFCWFWTHSNTAALCFSSNSGKSHDQNVSGSFPDSQQMIIMFSKIVEVLGCFIPNLSRYTLNAFRQYSNALS